MSNDSGFILNAIRYVLIPGIITITSVFGLVETMPKQQTLTLQLDKNCMQSIQATFHCPERYHSLTLCLRTSFPFTRKKTDCLRSVSLRIQLPWKVPFHLLSANSTCSVYWNISILVGMIAAVPVFLAPT